MAKKVDKPKEKSPVEIIEDMLHLCGFECELSQLGSVQTLRVKKPGMVNPADVRREIADIIATAGYRGYYLKEVYFYLSAKKPHRTDEEAFVEIEPLDEFKFDAMQRDVAIRNSKIVGKT